MNSDLKKTLDTYPFDTRLLVAILAEIFEKIRDDPDQTYDFCASSKSNDDKDALGALQNMLGLRLCNNL